MRTLVLIVLLAALCLLFSGCAAETAPPKLPDGGGNVPSPPAAPGGLPAGGGDEPPQIPSTV